MGSIDNPITLNDSFVTESPLSIEFRKLLTANKQTNKDPNPAGSNPLLPSSRAKQSGLIIFPPLQLRPLLNRALIARDVYGIHAPPRTIKPQNWLHVFSDYAQLLLNAVHYCLMIQFGGGAERGFPEIRRLVPVLPDVKILPQR